MVFDVLTPPQGPSGKAKYEFSHTRTKFSWFLSNALGGDNIAERWTDGQHWRSIHYAVKLVRSYTRA